MKILPLASACLALAAAAPAALSGQANQLASVLDPESVIELRDDSTRVILGEQLLFREERPDDAGSVELSFTPDSKAFRPLRWPRDLQRARGDLPIWISFSLRSAATARSWILAIGPNNMDAANVYVVSPDGRSELLSPSPSAPEREYRHLLSDYVFRLTIGPEEVKTIYARLSNAQSMRVRASIWDSYVYLRASAAETTFVGNLLGVLFALFAYTLFIVLSLRERPPIYFLIYLSCFFFYVLSADGAGFSHFIPGADWLARRATPFFHYMAIVGMLHFARSYMGTKIHAPVLDRILLALSAALPAVLLLLVFADYGVVMDMGDLLVWASYGALLASGIRCSAKRQRKAYFFLGGLVPLLMGIAASNASSLGNQWLWNDWVWIRGEQAGAMVQTLIFAFGITDSVNVMRVEKAEGQQRAIALLEHANMVKEDFLVGTSLEFRSPLYGMVGLLDRIETMGAGRAGAEETRLIALVRSEALRLLNSVANIATYARLRHDDVALQAERFSLKEAVEGAATMASHLAGGKDIAIGKSIDEAEVQTDVKALQQIVYNLFADSLRRSASGSVWIEGRVSEHEAVIDISDGGTAPPEEVLNRGLGSSTLGDPEALGPGLELLVTRLLAERLGGQIAYRRTGGMNTFEFRFKRNATWAFDQTSGGRSLPGLGGLARLGLAREAYSAKKAEGEQPRSQPAPSQPEQVPKPTRGMVLVADEDPVFLEALSHYLQDRGYEVLAELSMAKAATLAIESADLDLVLLDGTSAGRAGLAACARIRGKRTLGELPIVVMTDRESAGAVAEAFRVGASDYLPKLAPTELLFARVDTHVALKRAVQEAIETRQRVAELEKLKTLGVLAAGVAHEINTPNNAVLRNLPILSEIWREFSPLVRDLVAQTGGFNIRGWTGQELLHEVPSLLEDTYGAGRQIKKIVEDLKDYSRGSSREPASEVDLAAVAAYATRLLAPLVEKSTKRFQLDAPKGLPTVRADYQKLTQVVVNVLENALQSLPGPEAGVRLAVYQDEEADRLVVECSDEGGGIDPSIRPRLFEPFFTTKREAGGTGLGLPVALGIVKDHGGGIEIESEPGEGTTVRISFPRSHAETGE